MGLNKIHYKKIEQLFSFTRQTWAKWQKENRPIVALVEKYFNDEDLEEFLESGKIQKFEKTQKIKEFEIMIRSIRFEIEGLFLDTQKDNLEDFAGRINYFFIECKKFIAKKENFKVDFVDEDNIFGLIFEFVQSKDFEDFLSDKRIKIDRAELIYLLQSYPRVKLYLYLVNVY